MKFAQLIFAAVLACSFSTSVLAQAVTDSHKSVTTPPPLPFTTQIKKTVVFITTTCLHQPRPEELAMMTPEIVTKLTPEIVTKLTPAKRAEWDPELSGVLTPEQIAKMTPAQRAEVRGDSYSGTGFIVSVPETRIGNDQSFVFRGPDYAEKGNQSEDSGKVNLVTTSGGYLRTR